MNNQSEKDKPCPGDGVRNADGKCVLPEVSFSSFIMSLNTSALFHLGEIPHPESGEKTVDLALAKHTIDLLNILKDKTQGNLTTDEAQLLATVLYELQMRYVKASPSTRR